MDPPPPSRSKTDAIHHLGVNPWRTTVGLLPGSRTDEVRRHLPLLLASALRIAWHMPGVQFLIPKAESVARETVERRLPATISVRIAEGSIADALQTMDAAIVASGTATLDAALAGVPMVVVYRTSWPTYLAARAVIRLPHIALVNVVAGRRIVPELLQPQATSARIAEAVMRLLRDDAAREEMRRALREVRDRLGPPGAVERAAAVVREQLTRAGGLTTPCPS